MNYNHVMCGRCGGIVRLFNDNIFRCVECGKEIYLSGRDFDRLMANDKTGWLFPMIKKTK